MEAFQRERERERERERVKERRKFSRIKDKVFIFFKTTGSVSPFEAITIDISRGGLMFSTSKLLPEYNQLNFEICQPLSVDKELFLSVPAKAEVVWIRKTEENGEYLVGVKFTEMKEEHRNRLSRYIHLH